MKIKKHYEFDTTSSGPPKAVVYGKDDIGFWYMDIVDEWEFRVRVNVWQAEKLGKDLLEQVEKARGGG